MRIPARALAGLAAAALLAGPPSPRLAAAQSARQAAPPQPPPAAQAPATQPAAAGQQPSDPQQPPRIRTGINYVRVDVIVSDKSGKPLLDLNQSEFSLTEDGKPQTIDSFSVVKVDETTQTEAGPPRAIRTDFDEEREAARPEVRMFVILLDDYHVRRGNDMAVRKPLIDFLQNQLAPADMVAIMYPLTPITDLRFSRDRESAIGAINKFEGRKFIYEPRNTFEEQYAMYPAQVVERVRNQITMDALKGAAFRMGGLKEGRKSIIFVSEGFTASLPPQLNDPIASMPGLGNPARRDPNAPAVSDRQTMMDNADMFTDMQQVFSTLNRQNTSIYAVDPRGLAVFEYGINEGVGLQQDAVGLRASLDTLHVLANNTDGRAIVNRNDLASGMKAIIRDSSGYYLLGYNSTQAPTDGKFHKIDVNVKRKGVDVRARKGYWAYTTEDVARATAPPKPEPPSAVTTALSTLAAPSRDRAARFWIGTSRAEGGKARVTFVWEPVGPAPGSRQTDPAARVSLTVTGRDGLLLFRGRLPDAASPTASRTASSTAPAQSGASTSFDAPPGQLDLRIVVEGTAGQVIDSVGRELTVPDFTKVQVSFGTPRVYRVRSLPDLQALKASADAPPTVDREFSRTQRLFVRVDAYAPGGATPTVTARLLNRAGTSMADIPVQTTPGGRVEADLPLSAFAAGEYLLELTAKTDSGTAQELIAFRIGR